jgi:hypothetical protein
VLGAALAARGAWAQQAGALAGRVVSDATGEPLRANVIVVELDRATGSDDAGRFAFRGVPAGPATVRARAIGYRAATAGAVVPPGGTAEVTVRLTPVAERLAAVRTSATRPERERFEGAPNVGAITVGGTAVSRVPALGEADVLRAASLLPGVAARNDFTAGFNVRGGESDQNLVLLDGVPIYNPFHFGGLFGTFMDEAVARLDVQTGGFPAQYGGRLSSVLDVASRAEERPGVHGAAELSLLSSTLALGGALADARGSWNVAVRRTYADVVVKALTPEDFPYHFGDAQLHGTVLTPGGGTLAGTAYVGRDVLTEPEARTRCGPPTCTAGARIDDDDAFEFGWGNRALGLVLTQPFGAGVSLVQRAAFSEFTTRFVVPEEAVLLGHRNGELQLAGTVSARRGRHVAAAGYELSWYRVRYREELPGGGLDLDDDVDQYFGADEPSRFTFRQRERAAALFVDDVWSPGDRLVVRPGLRLERVPGARWTGLSPRLSAKYFVTRDLAVTAAGGRYAQWMHALRNEDLPVRVFDVWVASDPDVRVSTATHLLAGVERWFSSTRFAKLEAYHKRYGDLAEPPFTIDPRVRTNELHYFGGTSYGADLFLRQLEHGGVSGWLSYGYGVSRRTREGRDYAPAHDRRHNANLVASWAPGRRYVFGARYGLATGTPFTPSAGRITRRAYDPVRNTWTAGTSRTVQGERNAERYPFYQRLDVSAERAFRTRAVILRPYVNVVNAFNWRNVFLYDFDDDAGGERATSVSQLPLLPTVGLKAEF